MQSGLNALRVELRETQLKQCYFLLSAAGASIAFYLSKADPIDHDWIGVLAVSPLGLWAVSFWCGVRYVLREEDLLIANHTYLEIVDRDPAAREPARNWLQDEMKSIGRRRTWARKLQVLALVSGAAVFAFNEIILPGFEQTSGT